MIDYNCYLGYWPFYKLSANFEDLKKAHENDAIIIGHNEDIIKLYASEAEDIKKTYSYRIGRVITWLPRKCRGMVNCFREHGFKYTFWRILVNLHILKDPFKEED